MGGLYGVALGRAFFGESMFHRSRDASKVALVHLVARLRAGGFALLDTQFVTDHLKSFGAIEVPRRQYHKLLESALSGEGDFTALDKRGATARRCWRSSARPKRDRGTGPPEAAAGRGAALARQVDSKAFEAGRSLAGFDSTPPVVRTILARHGQAGSSP